MSKKNTIYNYLPEKTGELSNLQTKLDAEIFEQAKKKANEEGFTWREIIEASLKMYINEEK